MTTLYELTERYRALDALLDAEEGVTEDEAEMLAGIRAELDGMAPDAFAAALRYLRTVESQAHAATVEIERLQAIQKRARAKGERIRTLFVAVLDAQGATSVRTDIGTVAIQGNGGAQPMRLLVDVATLPDRLTKQPPRVPDMDALRKLAEQDPQNGLCVLDPRGKSLRIR